MYPGPLCPFSGKVLIPKGLAAGGGSRYALTVKDLGVEVLKNKELACASGVGRFWGLAPRRCVCMFTRASAIHNDPRYSRHYKKCIEFEEIIGKGGRDLGPRSGVRGIRGWGGVSGMVCAVGA